MAVIYNLQGNSDPYGPEHATVRLAEPMTLEHSDYWVISRPVQGRRELVPGAGLHDHWAIDDPALAFPVLKVTFRTPPAILPDISIGRQWVDVSEKARAVIEAEDPGVHQFHALRLVDEGGADWDGPQFYAMVVGRLLDVPNPTASKVSEMTMPRASDQPTLRQIATVEASPGLATQMAEFPLWAFSSQITRPFWNESMMRAMQQAELTGVDLIEPPGIRRHGESVNQIWFSELN